MLCELNSFLLFTYKYSISPTVKTISFCIKCSIQIVSTNLHITPRKSNGRPLSQPQGTTFSCHVANMLIMYIIIQCVILKLWCNYTVVNILYFMSNITTSKETFSCWYLLELAVHPINYIKECCKPLNSGVRSWKIFV